MDDLREEREEKRGRGGAPSSPSPTSGETSILMAPAPAPGQAPGQRTGLLLNPEKPPHPSSQPGHPRGGRVNKGGEGGEIADSLLTYPSE